MARCMICGRRWEGDAPPCGHRQQRTAELSGPTAQLLSMEDVQIAGYDVKSVIGRGGFGTVVAANRNTDGHPVAIKLVHRSDRDAHERLRLEARALETIGPPYVPELYGTGALDDDSPYFVFERIDLPTLAAKLAEWHHPLEPLDFLRIASAILTALEATHRHGFVHRDLKPENIFINDDPVSAKLIDFGIAKATGLASSRTTAGLALGTPEYMSPEQCEGRADIDLRADIYSVGVVLYELLTARPPFFGSSVDVREAHLSRRPPRPSRVANVAPIFDDVLLRCLAKDPSRRFTSARGLRRALSWAAEHTEATMLVATEGRTSAAQPSSTGASAEGRPTGRQGPSNRRQHMALLFFEATVGTDRVKQALVVLGGQLISVEGSRCVAVFDMGVSGNPVQRAQDSAQAFLEQRLCARALVDYDRVRVRTRPDGSRRVFSTAASQRDRFPRESDPPRVLFTTSAADMLVDLSTIDVRAGVVRPAPRDLDTNADATVFQLGSGPLIGREEELERILSSAEETFREHVPGLVTVLSALGYGKSHLCAAVLGRLRRAHPLLHVIQLRAREPLGSENYEISRVLLRAALDPPNQIPADFGREFLLSRFDPTLGHEIWSAAALVLGWLTADSPEIRKLSAAPAALRSAVTRAVGESLRSLARRHGVCCILDDAHYADESTLDALEYATLAETSAPLWVCVLATPGFKKARPSWGERAARTERIGLQALSNDNAVELCRRLLRPAENISQEAIQSLVDQTRGNPLLLVELARGIKRHGLIRQQSRGDSWYLAHDELEKLPDLPKVEWLAGRELAALPPALSAHARLVAQLGGEFSSSEVEGVLGELEADGLGGAFPLDAQVGIHRLLQHGLLVTHRDGRFGFRHHLIRDHVAQSTPAPVRLHVHRAAFHYHRDSDSMPMAHRLPRIALHAAQSGHGDTASKIYLELAEEAVHRHSYVDAELMYSRAIALLPDEETIERMRAYNGRGLMRYRMSRYQDALDDLDRAKRIAHELGDVTAEIELLLDEATILDWMQDYHQSRSLVECADTMVGDASTPLVAARLSLGLGRAKYRLRELDTALRLLTDAAERAEPLSDPGYETLVIALLLIATVYTLRNQQSEAEDTFARVIAQCEERGDRLHLASALNNRHHLWILRRDVERAAGDCLRCQQIGRDIGLSEFDYICAYNLAELHYYAGQLDPARAALDRALAVEASHSAKPLSLLLQARVQVFAGQWHDAEKTVEALDYLQRRSRQSAHHDALFIEAERLFHDAVRLATGTFHETDWDALRSRHQGIAQPFEIAEVTEMASLAAARHGEMDLAIQFIRDALALCSSAPHLIEERIERRLHELEAS